MPQTSGVRCDAVLSEKNAKRLDGVFTTVLCSPPHQKTAVGCNWAGLLKGAKDESAHRAGAHCLRLFVQHMHLACWGACPLDAPQLHWFLPHPWCSKTIKCMQCATLQRFLNFAFTGTVSAFADSAAAVRTRRKSQEPGSATDTMPRYASPA